MTAEAAERLESRRNDVYGVLASLFTAMKERHGKVTRTACACGGQMMMTIARDGSPDNDFIWVSHGLIGGEGDVAWSDALTVAFGHFGTTEQRRDALYRIASYIVDAHDLGRHPASSPRL